MNSPYPVNSTCLHMGSHKPHPPHSDGLGFSLSHLSLSSSSVAWSSPQYPGLPFVALGRQVPQYPLLPTFLWHTSSTKSSFPFRFGYFSSLCGSWNQLFQPIRWRDTFEPLIYLSGLWSWTFLWESALPSSSSSHAVAWCTLGVLGQDCSHNSCIPWCGFWIFSWREIYKNDFYLDPLWSYI